MGQAGAGAVGPAAVRLHAAVRGARDDAGGGDVGRGDRAAGGRGRQEAMADRAPIYVDEPVEAHDSRECDGPGSTTRAFSAGKVTCRSPIWMSSSDAWCASPRGATTKPSSNSPVSGRPWRRPGEDYTLKADAAEEHLRSWIDEVRQTDIEPPHKFCERSRHNGNGVIRWHHSQVSNGSCLRVRAGTRPFDVPRPCVWR
jgi:hypothetical protein